MNFGKSDARVFRVGSCILDSGKQCVVRNPRSSNRVDGVTQSGDTCQLAPRDFKVLQTLISRAPDLVSGPELLAAAWQDKIVCGNVIYQSIGRLRSAFGDSPVKSQYIATVSKRGYRLVAPVTPLSQHKQGPSLNMDAQLAPVLIVPFENLHGSDLAAVFLDSMGFEIGHQLIAAGISVIHMDRAGAAQDTVQTTRQATKDRFLQAHQVDARTVMEASVLTNATKVRVMVRLTETATRLQIWSGRYDFPIDEAFDMQCLLAESAVRDICRKLPDRLGPRAAARRTDESIAEPEARVVGLI